MNTKLWKGIFWGLILVLPFWLWVGSQAWGTTYYMRADGTTANATAATGPCSTQANCMSNAVHTAEYENFSAGDIINVCDDGGIIRGQLTIGSSGSSGSPITYQAASGDSPVFSGADILTSFTEGPSIAEEQITANVWVTTKKADSNIEAQGIKSESEITVPYIDVYLKKIGTPTGNIAVEIWASAGTPARPNGGSPVATTDNANVSTVSGSGEWVRFTFASAPTLSANATYFLFPLPTYASSDTDALQANVCTSENYRGGDPFMRLGCQDGAPPTVSWGQATQDENFKIWKNVGGGYYYKAGITTEPHQVFYDSVRLTENDGATTSVGSNEWDWDSNTLYINVGEDPAGGTVEISQRNYALWMSAENYLIFEGIHFTINNDNNLCVALNAGSNNIFDDCEVSYGHGNGLGITSGSNVIVRDCEVHHNGFSGIHSWKVAATSGNENQILRNTVYNNNQFGIYIVSDYHIVEQNKVYNNGCSTLVGVGILVGNVFDADDYPNYVWVRHNLVYGQRAGDNSAVGIEVDEESDYAYVYDNVCYSNDGPGFMIFDSNYVYFYNNTSYGNCQNSDGGITTFAEFRIRATNAGDSIYNVIKNNIAQATEANTYAIYVDDEVEGSTGLDISNNNWYVAASNWYYWKDSGGNVLATWNALTGVGTDLNSNPLFTSAAGDDFTLDPNSPCRHGAVYIPGYTTKLRPEASWPDNVVTIDDILSIGAYGVYRGSAEH